MRSTLSWPDLRGLSVGIWGLGVECSATIARLGRIGVVPVVVDDRPDGRTAGDAPVLATGEGGLDALARCDVVVKAPGVSRYREEVVALERAGIPVVGGLGLWMNGVDRSRVACVTGTKGKSTTAAVMGHLLRGLGVAGIVAGNIGQAPWDPALDDVPADLWVVETSSYQATDVAVSPAVVAVTSLFPDHLDWHGGVDAYYRDKLSLTSLPGEHVTVVNGDSDEIERWSGHLGGDVRRVHLAGEDVGWARALGLPGDHNLRNALVARRCLVELGVPGAGDAEALARAAEGFTGLDSRLQLVASAGGVEFYDDSLSTNVGPMIAAVDAFPGRRIALLAGGYDRGIDYAPLAAALAARTSPTLVLTLPDNGPRVRAAVEALGDESLRAVDCADVAEAVEAAYGWARPDGVVLLSPAAPSFGVFRDYKARAAAFRDAVARVSAGEQDARVEDAAGVEGGPDIAR